jgi:hypothetical protein
MRLKDSTTPREQAHMMAATLIDDRARAVQQDPDQYGLTPAQAREVAKNLARLHDLMLNKGKLDGLPVEIREI